ncbi:hypothetical protein V6N11_065844 [Hibiscus sabdariffa]|uniref:RNase H type-1 domain-containing protein n=1 Tax=Hibiscus sabdariffa TaxID=183260 RepID=A0ABR2PIW4_9ROSI
MHQVGIGICHEIVFNSLENSASGLDHFLQLEVANGVELGRDLNDCSAVRCRIEPVFVADFLEFVDTYLYRLKFEGKKEYTFSEGDLLDSSGATIALEDINALDCMRDNLGEKGVVIKDKGLKCLLWGDWGMPRSLVPPKDVVCRWSKPLQGWIKINTDEARNPSKGFAYCGGVGCDENMIWCFGYSKKIGICSTYDTELWTIYEGLSTTWSLDYSKVIIETNNKEAYRSLSVNNRMMIGSSFCAHFASMINRDWEVDSNGLVESVIWWLIDLLRRL